jgi:hypothetical protein
MRPIIDNRLGKPTTRLMGALEPLQFAIVTDTKSLNNGHLVMRTASEVDFEVIDLTMFEKGECWGPNHLVVTPVIVDVKFTIVDYQQ